MKNFKKKITRFINLFQYLTVMSLCAAITTFVFANSYELAFGKDLPYVQALEPVHVKKFLPENKVAEISIATLPGTVREGGFGTPETLKLPSQGAKVEMVPAVYKDNEWLGRLNAGHYYILTSSKNNNIGTTFVYVREGWRSVADASAIKTGENIFIDTNREWRYMFRIDQVNTYRYTDNYIVEDSVLPKLVLVIDDAVNQVNYIVSATFVNIQNIQQ